MRLFVAAYPPTEACDDLARRLADLNVTRAAARGVNTRLARRDTWHVTLAFLGEVPDDRASAAGAAIERATGWWRESGTPPPRLRLAGGGCFGRGRFTVLWAGVDGDREPLDRLARRVRRELKAERLPFDARPLRPHLTIARPGDRLDRAAIDADRTTLAAYEGPAWPLTAVELIRSHLGPSPRYDHLTAASLT